jgi:hypothetical protein
MDGIKLDINLVGNASSKNKEGVDLLNEVGERLSKPKIDFKDFKLELPSKSKKPGIDYKSLLEKSEKAIALFKAAIKIDKKNEVYKSNLETACKVLYSIYNQEGVEILNSCQKKYENYFKSNAIIEELANIGPSKQLNEDGVRMFLDAVQVVRTQGAKMYKEVSVANDKFKMAIKGEPLNETYKKNKEVAEGILSQTKTYADPEKSIVQSSKNGLKYLSNILLALLLLAILYSGFFSESIFNLLNKLGSPNQFLISFYKVVYAAIQSIFCIYFIGSEKKFSALYIYYIAGAVGLIMYSKLSIFWVILYCLGLVISMIYSLVIYLNEKYKLN